MPPMIYAQIRSTLSSVIKGSSDIDVTFRRHTLYFSLAMLISGSVCLLLQISETAVQINSLQTSSASSLHYYNGFWNGGLLLGIAIFALTTAVFYPSLNPVITPLTESAPVSALEKLYGRKINSFGVLHVLLALCLGLFVSGIVSVSVSSTVYPHFPGILNATVLNSTSTDKYIINTAEFRRVRTACLTMQGVLVWFSVLGMFWTTLTSAVTLNRIIHYRTTAEKSPEQLLRKASSVSNPAPLSRQNTRKKSTISKYGELPQRGEKNGSFTMEVSPLTISSGSDNVSGSDSLRAADKLLKESVEGSEHRNKALITLAEFLRNRRISRYQPPVVHQLEQNQPTTSV